MEVGEELMLVLVCSPLGFALGFHLSYPLPPFLCCFLHHFFFFFIFCPAEPARFTGFKWKSIHTTGTAGEAERKLGGGGRSGAW